MGISLWQLLILVIVVALVVPLAFRVRRMRGVKGGANRPAR